MSFFSECSLSLFMQSQNLLICAIPVIIPVNLAAFVFVFQFHPNITNLC